MDIEYNNIINEWYNGKSVEKIINMIINWIDKYPKLLEIEEINKINNSINDNDSINDIVEELVISNLNKKINQLL
jgi:hypothetical protein